MYFVKSEELRNVNLRKDVVYGVLNFTGINDRYIKFKQKVNEISSSSSSSSSTLEDEDSKMRILELNKEIDIKMELFHNSLSELHNQHNQPPPPPPSSSSSSTNDDDEILVKYNRQKYLEKSCYEALNKRNSYLDVCNQRLARLLQDEKWRWH